MDKKTLSPDKTAPASDEEKAIRDYLPLMYDVVHRINLVKEICEGSIPLDRRYIREFSYLQFRRICELIALGCLRLHWDIPQAQSKAARKEWHAEAIMKLLRRNYLHAFPQPVFSSKTETGMHIQANSKPNALTYSEFNQLYNECGDVLHVGTIRSLDAAKLPSEEDYQRVLMWTGKIIDLLNEHTVTRANNEGIFLVALMSENGWPTCTHLWLNPTTGEASMVQRYMEIKK